jgi:hypothetical protein
MGGAMAAVLFKEAQQPTRLFLKFNLLLVKDTGINPLEKQFSNGAVAK